MLRWTQHDVPLHASPDGLEIVVVESAQVLLEALLVLVRY
jgi:hypothetical protein